jgi:hypothetical protein
MQTAVLAADESFKCFRFKKQANIYADCKCVLQMRHRTFYRRNCNAIFARRRTSPATQAARDWLRRPSVWGLILKRLHESGGAAGSLQSSDGKCRVARADGIRNGDDYVVRAKRLHYMPPGRTVIRSAWRSLTWKPQIGAPARHHDTRWLRQSVQ